MKVPGVPYVQGRNYQTNPAGRHYGIAVHCTSNNASASSEASYAQVRTDGIGSHFFTDHIQTIQSIDTIFKVNHAGSSNGNNYAVCLEQTGFTSWDRNTWVNSIHWAKQAYALAAVIKAELPGFQVRRASVAEMKSNPRVAAFYSHDDMRLAWGGTTHTDPGPNYPWDRLFDSVNEALGGDDMQADERIWLFNASSIIGNLGQGLPSAPIVGPDGSNSSIDLTDCYNRIAQAVIDLLPPGGGGSGPVDLSEQALAEVEDAAEEAVRTVLGGLDAA